MLICPLKSINFKIAKIKDVFHDPDSPTMPMVSLSLSSKLISSIAFT